MQDNLDRTKRNLREAKRLLDKYDDDERRRREEKIDMLAMREEILGSLRRATEAIGDGAREARVALNPDFGTYHLETKRR